MPRPVKFSDEQIAAIRAAYDGSNARQVCAQFGISKGYMFQLVHGRRRRASELPGKILRPQ